MAYVVVWYNPAFASEHGLIRDLVHLIKRLGTRDAPESSFVSQQGIP